MPRLPGWDSLDAITRFHSWAEIAGIAFLALLVVAEILAYGYGHRRDEIASRQQADVERAHEERISILNQDTARLKVEAEVARAQIADAQARAAEANLELARIKQPRTLTSEQSTAITNAMLPFAGQQFSGLVASGVSDAPSLWTLIDQALRGASWKRELPRGLSVGDPPHGIPIVPSDGVTLLLPEADVSRLTLAANALTNALNYVGIKTVKVIDNGPQSRNGIIVIEIGLKP